MNLFAPPPDPPRAQIAQLREWVRQVFAVPDTHQILIHELRCLEPDCPDLETVLLIVGADAPLRTYRLLRPLTAITYHDIQALAIEENRP